jgi:hypothetical protein
LIIPVPGVVTTVFPTVARPFAMLVEIYAPPPATAPDPLSPKLGVLGELHVQSVLSTPSGGALPDAN